MLQPQGHPHNGPALRQYFVQARAALALSRGVFLYTPDQAARALFLVMRGHVRLQLVSAEGRALTIRLIEPGSICGHATITGDARYDTFAEAVTPVEVMMLTRQQIEQALRGEPSLALVLIEEVGRHYGEISQRLDEVAFKSVPSRLASLLVAMARDTQTSQVRLPRRTHQQLADMINAQRETVTKTINEFRALRLLEIDRTEITLLNLERLQELAAR